MVRNMQYRTDDKSNKEKDEELRFRVEPIENTIITFGVPQWLTPKSVIDPISKETLNHEETESGKMEITIPKLSGYKLVWIENK